MRMNEWLKRASHKCPRCGGDVPVTSPDQFGDVQCGSCGNRLLFIKSFPSPLLTSYPDAYHVREALVRVMANLLGVEKSEVRGNVSLVNDLGMDSLDLVELLMDVEEELDRK